MKKRILIALAALTMLLCVPLIANAASVDDLEFDPTTGTITGCNTEAEGELVIPEEINGVKVTSIGENAFSHRVNLTSVELPDSVTSIGEWAFWDCSSLTSVIIPNGVTSIGVSAFRGCENLTSITIPDSTTSIGNMAFVECGSLNISVNPNNEYYCDIDGVLFSKDKKTILAYAKDKIQPSYDISESVTCIGNWTFFHCGGLTSITIPENLRT